MRNPDSGGLAREGPWLARPPHPRGQDLGGWVCALSCRRKAGGGGGLRHPAHSGCGEARPLGSRLCRFLAVGAGQPP